MTHIELVRDCYIASWRRRRLVVPIYVALRLAAYAVIAPVLGIMVNLGVSLSNQSALTDQDIARFLFTPTGFVVAVALISVLLLNEVLSLAVLTGVLRARLAGTPNPFRAGLAKIVMKARALITFAVLLVLRILFIAVPFLLACLLVVGVLLSEFDINYYLTFRPPDFYKAVAIIIPMLAIMVWILLSQLTAWALALHYVVFGGTSARGAFGKSAKSMAGRKVKVVKDLAVWLLARAIIAAIIAAFFSLFIGVVPVQGDSGLPAVLLLVLVLVALWSLVGLIGSAVSAGALAQLLNAHFDQDADVTEPQGSDQIVRFTLWRVLALVAVVVVAGFVSGAALLDNISTEDDVQVIAHRGAAGSRPENTLASVLKAIEDRADWVEIDVQETADGDIIVVHDSDFMKLAGVDLKVWDSTLADLENIDVGSWFDPAFADQRTPLLRDVLELARDKAKVLIELKYYGQDVALEERVARVVEDSGMEDQIAIMSLKYPAVQKMQQLRPDWRAGVLAASAVGNAAQLDGDFIAVSKGFASSGLISATQAVGKDIYVWTINDPLEMSKMISKGVDGLITDEPELLHKVLNFRAELNTAERLLLWMSQALGLELSTKAYRDAEP